MDEMQLQRNTKGIERNRVCERVLFSRAARFQLSQEGGGGGARACLTFRGQSTQSKAGQNSTDRTLALGGGSQELAWGLTDSRPPCHHTESLDGKCQLPGERSLAER